MNLSSTLNRVAAATMLAIAAMSCAPTVVPGPTQTVQPTAANTAAATFSVPATFAAVCGTASDRVARTASTNATFLLNSPGRSPVKIASTGNAPIDAVIPGGYLCLLLGAGVPFPTLVGSLGPQMPGFVAEGTFPATAARPAPTGFVLPQACAFVEPPVVGTDYTRWAVDCGAQANHDARGTLAPAFTQQAWVGCGVGLGSATWMKGDMRLIVSEGSGVPGPSGYPTLSQPARTIQTACG